MKHVKSVSRCPAVAQSNIEAKLDALFAVIENAGQIKATKN